MQKVRDKKYRDKLKMKLNNCYRMNVTFAIPLLGAIVSNIIKQLQSEWGWQML